MTEAVAGIVGLAGSAALALLGTLFAIVGGKLGRTSLTGFRQSGEILGSGTTDIASLSAGSCEIAGTVRVADAGTVAAPFSGEAAVVTGNGITWRANMAGVEENARRKSTVDHEAVPFVVEDDTGAVLVTPHEGANYGHSTETYWEQSVDGAEKPPEIDRWGAAVSLEEPQFSPNVATYTEGTIAPGEEVYVKGVAVDPSDPMESASGDPAELDRVVTGGEEYGKDLLVSTDGRVGTGVGTVVGSLLLMMAAVMIGGMGLVLLFVGLLYGQSHHTALL